MTITKKRWPQDEQTISTMAERCIAARKWKGLNPNQLAKRAKVTHAAIQQIEDGSTKTLRAETAFRISDVLEISARWLVWGTGSIHKWADLTADEDAVIKTYRKLPPKLQEHAKGVLQSLLAASAPPSPENPFPDAPKPR